MKKLKSRVIGQKPIKWRACEWLQNENLKKLPEHLFKNL